MLKILLMVIFFVGVLFVLEVFVNQGGVNYGGIEKKVCGFFDSINGLLNMVLIVVVIIVVIFVGYQIVFVYKCIGDVVLILIGGVLIGVVGQIVCMLLGDDYGICEGKIVMLIQQVVQYYSV